MQITMLPKPSLCVIIVKYVLKNMLYSEVLLNSIIFQFEMNAHIYSAITSSLFQSSARIEVSVLRLGFICEIGLVDLCV